MVNVGFLGLGTVGAATLNLLQRNAQDIASRTSDTLRVCAASVRDKGRDRDCDTTGITLTTDPLTVVNNPAIDVVVELIGGVDVARDCVLQAIAHGKSVVTANKALIALHGDEIFKAADEKGVTVAFEAAVAAGIPIIRSLREGLSANHIERVIGIMNGTTNYILSTMATEPRSFEAALADAQQRGYAEADPSMDIGGIDAAHKLTILAAIAFGIPLQFGAVSIEGITTITVTDIAYAKQWGYTIRSVGIAQRKPEGIALHVHPIFVPNSHVLAHVEGVSNAVLVETDSAGPVLHHGAGAGGDATASAVVADLIDVVRHGKAHKAVPHLSYQPEAVSDTPMLSIDTLTFAYYLRLQVENRPGVLAEITATLAQSSISIESMVQQKPGGMNNSSGVLVVMMTYPVLEEKMNQARVALTTLPACLGDVACIRIASFL